MSRSTTISVLSLAAGAMAGVANVCVQQPYGLMQDFRDYEPAKSYCAPHFPAQTITKTLPHRCLTTTSTVILGTSTVTTTSHQACPTADVLAKRSLEERQWSDGWSVGDNWGSNEGNWGRGWGDEGWYGWDSGDTDYWGNDNWWEGQDWWGGNSGWGQSWGWNGGWGWGGEHGGWGQGGRGHGGWGWGKPKPTHPSGGKPEHHPHPAPHKPTHPSGPKHAQHCENNGDCGQGEHCYHENRHWWHDSHDHWWCGGPDHPWQGGWGGRGGWGNGGWKRDASASDSDIEVRWGGEGGHGGWGWGGQGEHGGWGQGGSGHGGWGWGHGPNWWHRPSGGQCVPNKHHQHPHKPPHHPPPPPAYSTSTPPVYSTSTPPVYSTSTPPVYSTSTPPVYSTSTGPESGYPMPTYNAPHPKPKPYQKREAAVTMSAQWANYEADLVKCGYDCIQTACSCVAATKTEHHTPAPTCTQTSTKETIVRVTTTIAGEPRDCQHGDLRKN